MAEATGGFAEAQHVVPEVRMPACPGYKKFFNRGMDRQATEGLRLRPRCILTGFYCTVRLMVLEVPDPGFWLLNVMVPAAMTSEAGMATVSCVLLT